MIETAIEVTDKRIPSRGHPDHHDVWSDDDRAPCRVDRGRAGSAGDAARGDHELWLITKGDLFDQESKIARSGLVPLFDTIEIVSEKDQATYRAAPRPAWGESLTSS